MSYEREPFRLDDEAIRGTPKIVQRMKIIGYEFVGREGLHCTKLASSQQRAE